MPKIVKGVKVVRNMDTVQLYKILRDLGYSHKAAFNVVLCYLA